MIAFAGERQPAPVERRKGRSVADRHNGGVGEPLVEQLIERGLGRLVERSGGLIQEQKIGCVEERTRNP